MKSYESEMANDVEELYKSKIASTGLDLISITDIQKYRYLKIFLNTDGRAKDIAVNGRRETFLGIDADSDFGTYQTMAVFDRELPVAIFTLGVEPRANLGRLMYVRRETGPQMEFSFEEIYGYVPDYLIVPAYTEILESHRSTLSVPAYRAFAECIGLLSSKLKNSMVELVAQGNGVDIGLPRIESKNIVRLSKLVGLEQLGGVGSCPSFGPVFFRY